LEQADVVVRHGFVRKVFGILCVQFLITCAVAWPFVAHPVWGQQFVQHNGWAFGVTMMAPLAVMCAFMCNPGLSRQFPQNYLLLLLFTVCEGFMVGVCTLKYTTGSVLMVAAITGVVVFALMLYAFQTKHDFTGMGSYLFAAMMVLICCSFLFYLFPVGDTMHKAFAVFGSLIFSMFIVYDTQLIIGGKHAKRQFSVDDYVLAAITIYLDIINLFLQLLALFGDRR